MRMSSAWRALLAALCFSLFWPTVMAQDKWPSKPVRIVSPFPAGGGNDVIARQIALGLSERIGVPVIVENRAGAAGTIGTEFVSKQPADGYTLGIGVVTTHSIAPSFYSQLRYDPVKDFTPLTMVATYEAVLVANPSLGVNTLAELMQLARAQPGKLTFASSGSGAWSHLGVELLNSKAGVKMVHVPYKGIPAAMTDLLGGRVDVLFDIAASQHAHVKNGKLKALAVSSKARSPLLPEVPTLSELGYPDFDSMVWLGLFAPPNMAPGLTAQINAELVAVLRSRKLVDFLREQGAQIATNTPAEFSEYIRGDIVRWRRVMQAAGVQPE